MIQTKTINAFINIVTLLILIAIGYLLASIFWMFYAGVDIEVEAPPAAVASASQSAGLPTINVDRVKRWNLFGVYRKPATKPVAQQTQAPKTKLKLELHGVFHGEEEGLVSTAIIAEVGKPGELFKVGDKIRSGVVLDSVYADHVVLERNGRNETLYFPEGFNFQGNSKESSRSNSGSVNRPSRSVLRSEINNRRKATPAAVNTDSQVAKMISSGKAHSPEQIVQAIVSDLEERPEAAIAEIGLEPGSNGGYRVGTSAARDVLRTLGLRAGDVILSVNGQPLGNISSDAATIKSAMGGGKAKVEIQRGSRRFTVSVDVPSM